MTRDEIQKKIESIISEYWVYYDDDTHSVTADKVLTFLEQEDMEHEGLRLYFVLTSDQSIRRYWAEDNMHAREQSHDAFPDLEVLHVDRVVKDVG